MIRIIFALMVVAGGHAVFAQEISADVKADITKEIESRLKEIVTPLVVAEKLKMEFPPKSPTETVANLDKKVSQEVMKQVDTKYPPSTRDVHLKAAKEKYILYKKGDMVQDLRIRPAGRKSVLSGEYKGENRKGEHVVGGYPIPKVDMTEDVICFFDPEANKKKIETYIKNKMFYFHDDREKMKKDITPVVKNKFFTEAGYYKSGDKYYPALEFLKKAYEEEKSKVKMMLMKEVENQALAAASKEKEGGADDPFGEQEKPKKEETVGVDIPKEEPPAEEESSQKRKRVPLFDPSFYDPNF